jgi:hypothetical protein
MTRLFRVVVRLCPTWSRRRHARELEASPDDVPESFLSARKGRRLCRFGEGHSRRLSAAMEAANAFSQSGACSVRNPWISRRAGERSIGRAWEQASLRNVTTSQAEQQRPPLHVIYSNRHYVQLQADGNRAKIDVPRERLRIPYPGRRADAAGHERSGSENRGHVPALALTLPERAGSRPMREGRQSRNADRCATSAGPIAARAPRPAARGG